MSFLRNAWYVAGWSDDVQAGALVHRRLLNEEVVFFRKGDGTPAALHDRCPHRFIPLHMGTLNNDAIQCCYHGLKFDCTGRCVHNPHGDGKIPAAAQVRSYPVHDRHGILWIWMGDQPADPSKIPDYSMLDADSGFQTTRGAVKMDCNYVLMGENLLDLSHVPFLHAGLLGTPEMTAAQPQVREEGGHLYVDRTVANCTVPKVFDLVFRNDGQRVDSWMNMRWTAPSCYLLDVGVKAPGGERETAGWFYGVHLLTPETASTTHYHFASARPPGAVIDTDLDAELARCRRIAFAEQDKPIVDEQQRIVGDRDLWSMKPVLLSIDAGPVRMRRTIERLVAAEVKTPAGPH